jgi:hypothetical protein
LIHKQNCLQADGLHVAQPAVLLQMLTKSKQALLQPNLNCAP